MQHLTPTKVVWVLLLLVSGLATVWYWNHHSAAAWMNLGIAIMAGVGLLLNWKRA